MLSPKTVERTIERFSARAKQNARTITQGKTHGQ